MTMHEHTYEEHHHSHHDENADKHVHAHEEHRHSHHEGHEHEHTHDNGSSSALDAWKVLCECVTAAGIMDRQEITAALTTHQRKPRKQKPDLALMPYLLTAMPGQPPTAALRWDFDSSRVREFADWCTTVLRERFGITWQIVYEDEDVQLGPPSLRILQNGLQEQCDWRYLNQSHWIGAFCTIANRLLEPAGITALSLETGWFDTVIVFCRRNYAEELLNWFPESE
jgi:hypothetical protein